MCVPRRQIPVFIHVIDGNINVPACFELPIGSFVYTHKHIIYIYIYIFIYLFITLCWLSYAGMLNLLTKSYRVLLLPICMFVIFVRKTYRVLDYVIFYYYYYYYYYYYLS